MRNIRYSVIKLTANKIYFIHFSFNTSDFYIDRLFVTIINNGGLARERSLCRNTDFYILYLVYLRIISYACRM